LRNDQKKDDKKKPKKQTKGKKKKESSKKTKRTRRGSKKMLALKKLKLKGEAKSSKFKPELAQEAAGGDSDAEGHNYSFPHYNSSPSI
jgi:hypothetical protein